MQQDAAFAANFGNFAHRLNHAGLIVRGHDRNQPRFGADRFGELIKIDNSVVGSIEPGHFKIFVFLQMLDRVQDRVVLGFI